MLTGTGVGSNEYVGAHVVDVGGRVTVGDGTGSAVGAGIGTAVGLGVGTLVGTDVGTDVGDGFGMRVVGGKVALGAAVGSHSLETTHSQPKSEVMAT